MADLSTLTLDDLTRPVDGQAQTIAHQITRIQAATNTLANTLEWANLCIPTGKKYWNGTEYAESDGTTLINEESSLDALVYALSAVFKQPIESEGFEPVGDGYQIQLPVHTNPETNETYVTSVTLPTGYYQGVKITPVFEESDGNYDNVINVLDELVDSVSTQTYNYNPSDYKFDYVKSIRLTVQNAELSDTFTLYKNNIRRYVTKDGWISGQINTSVPEATAHFITSAATLGISDVVKNGYAFTNGNNSLYTNKDQYEWVYDGSAEPNPRNPLNVLLEDSSCNLTHINQNSQLNSTVVPIDRQASYAIRIEPGIIHAPRYIYIPSFQALTLVSSNPISADKVLNGYTGFVNGGKIAGSMPDNSTKDDLIISLNLTEDGFTIKPPKGYYDGEKSYGTSNIKYWSISDIQIAPASENKEDGKITLTSASSTETMLAGYYSGGSRQIDVQPAIIVPSVNYAAESNDEVVTFEVSEGWVSEINVSIAIDDASIVLSDQNLTRDDHIYTVVNKTENAEEPNFFMKSVEIDLTGLYGTLAAI